jgi:PqqD family protein of HPr-rel-A system
MLVVETLDDMTLIYQRRSGATHMVTAPVPEILSAMAMDSVDAATIAARLADRFDLTTEGDDIIAIIHSRLAEMAALGLVEIL